MSRFLFNNRRAQARIAGLPPEQEEFYERLGSDADVDLEPGYNQDVIFDEQFERRAHEIQRTPAANNAVTVIPSKQGPWTANNNLGTERHFEPDINNRQTILRLPEWGFPEDWTVCLGLSYDADVYNPVNTLFGITAELTVGVGGTTQLVEIDWLQGASISLPMNALDLVAQFAAGSNEGGLVALPEDLRLRVTLCRGSVKNSRPTRSYNIDVFNDGANGIIVPVPPFAKSVYLLPRANPGPISFFADPAGFVNFISGPNPATSAIVAQLQRAQFVTYVNVAESIVGAPVAAPVPEGARFLHLPTVTLAAFSGFQIQFLLGI